MCFGFSHADDLIQHNEQGANWIRDFDLTGRWGWISREPQYAQDRSVEARIHTPQGNRWRASIGINYYEQEFTASGGGGDAVTGCFATADLGTCRTALLFPSSFQNNDQPKVLGIFGALEYDLTEQLTLSFEGHWQQDDLIKGGSVNAGDRVQGPAPGVQGKAGIIHRPDVRRMLMLMRVLTESSRAIGYVTAAADRAHNSADPEQAAYYQQRLDLLVPVAKAWCTDSSIETTNLGVQIHGGMGYVEETDVAQYVRDARVLTIYEGTTGIQAMDLVGRKFLRDQGQGMSTLITEMEGFASTMDTSEAAFAELQKPLQTPLQTSDCQGWLPITC